MKGIKPIAQQKEELEKSGQSQEEAKVFKIPLEMFADFKEIDKTNEDLFEYLAF